jgi:hypothetical protein
MSATMSFDLKEHQKFLRNEQKRRAVMVAQDEYADNPYNCINNLEWAKDSPESFLRDRGIAP